MKPNDPIDDARQKFRAGRPSVVEREKVVKKKSSDYERKIKELIRDGTFAIADKITGLTRVVIDLYRDGSDEKKIDYGTIGELDSEGRMCRLINSERLVFVWTKTDGRYCKVIPVNVVDPNEMGNAFNHKITRVVDTVVVEELDNLDGRVSIVMSFLRKIAAFFNLALDYMLVKRTANGEQMNIIIEINLRDIKPK